MSNPFSIEFSGVVEKMMLIAYSKWDPQMKRTDWVVLISHDRRLLKHGGADDILQ